MAAHQTVNNLEFPNPAIQRHDTGKERIKQDVIDLTEDSTDGSRDHMHAVVNLLRSASSPAGEGHLRTHAPAPSSGYMRASHAQVNRTDPFPVTYISSEDDEAIQPIFRRANSKRPVPRSFPFLSFPPEIRNSVYRVLLTTPNIPIELPRLMATRERSRAAQCRKSRRPQNRAAHKRIFLEILTTCRQIHDEATGIMYGCNVFKYRSNHREGARTAMLPTRHLQLLKHIKISVISDNPLNEQEKWVADLIKCFVKEEILLDSFELTWYGWQRYFVEWEGPVCRMLQSLKVEKQLVIYINGKARMRRTTKAELEKAIRSRRVEVHRPRDEVTQEEIDDEDIDEFWMA